MDLSNPAWWHGIVELEPLVDGGTPAGVRLGFHTTATRLTLDLIVDLDDPSPVDIVVDGHHLARRPISAPVTVDLGPDTKLVEIWLPQYGCAGIRSLTLDDDAPTRSRRTRSAGPPMAPRSP